MLGLKRGTVKLASDHKEWARLFIKEKKVLIKTLGDCIVAIEHVGSTAISGVPAKPIIDIRISVASLKDSCIKEIAVLLGKIGYAYMHKFPGRHFFLPRAQRRKERTILVL